MLHFQNLKQLDNFHMYQSREEWTEELLLSNGRNPSCCSLTLLFCSSPPLTLNLVNPITDMISRKPPTRGRKTVSFQLAQLPEPAYHIVTQTPVLSQGTGKTTCSRETGQACSSQSWHWHKLLWDCTLLQKVMEMQWYPAFQSWFCGADAHWTLCLRSNRS